MIENLLFSLNATMPVFLMMLLGFLLHQIGWIDDAFASKMNKFVFRLPLPALVFSQLATTDFVSTWDTKFVLFCFFVTLFSIFIVTILSYLIIRPTNKNPQGSISYNGTGGNASAHRGEFIQAAYRSSAALLGIAYIQNIYGDATMSALMILGAVPLYNIMAVVILTMTENNYIPGNDTHSAIKKTIYGIFTNPIIIGIFLGFLWSLLKIPMPPIADKFISNLGGIAAPLGLIAMGASVKVQKIKGQLAPSLVASFMKLFGLCALFLPLAVHMGFRDQKLVAILIMLGSATTVSSFVMAKSMGHDGTLTSNTVIITTLLSAFSLTFWLFVARTGGWI